MPRVSFDEKDKLNERSSLINDVSESSRQESYELF